MKIVDARVIVCSPGRNFVTLKLTTEDGLTGLGDATLNGRELAVAAYLQEHVVPLLTGRDARRIEDTWHYLYKGAYWRRGPVTMTAIAAVDTALWDLQGKALGVPVYQLLGGASHESVMIYGHANCGTIDETAAAVAEYVRLGYRAIRAQCGVPDVAQLLPLVSAYYEQLDDERRGIVRSMQLIADEARSYGEGLGGVDAGHWQVILDHIKDVVITVGADGAVKIFNPTGERVFGYSRAEIIGQSIARLLPDLSGKQRTLDVVILHRLILERCLGITEEAVKKESYITYVRDPEEAMNSVRSGQAQVAFLLNATRLDQLRDIAYEGNVMPQKSTDFYPKVLSGLTMYSMDL